MCFDLFLRAVHNHHTSLCLCLHNNIAHSPEFYMTLRTVMKVYRSSNDRICEAKRGCVVEKDV